MAIEAVFQNSGKTAQWDDSYESIIELVEDNGVAIFTECEADVRGTCGKIFFNLPIREGGSDGT